MRRIPAFATTLFLAACREAVPPAPSSWLSQNDSINASTIIAEGRRVADSVSDPVVAAEIRSSIPDRTLFTDSIHYHRALDRVRVSVEVARGGVPRDALGRFYPAATPHLAWARISGKGLHFQPVNSVQHVIYPVPKPWDKPVDTLLAVGEALWQYRVPTRLATGKVVPMWEYDFAHTSGGVSVTAPWHSGMAEGYALMLFAENYRHTGLQVWRDRAYAVLPALMTSWDSGGVRLPDTSAGYWFEEFHPTVQVFNGAAHVALHIGVAARDFADDPELTRIARSADAAILSAAPRYDDGRWTLYSRTQGWNTQVYHDMHIALMRELAAQTGDARYTALADKWAAYVRPY
jgi:hypothetical protein